MKSIIFVKELLIFYLNFDTLIVSQQGQVVEIYEQRRDSGMYSFPCFRVDKPVDHGFSGGPVFWNNKLCGIVSGGGLDNDTYVASLWPLCLLEYEYPDLGLIGGNRVFSELFDSKVLNSQDWPQIKDHIQKRYDEAGKPYAYLEI